MLKSLVNEKFEIKEGAWVVSLMNTGSGTTGKLTGHSVLLLEGLDSEVLLIRQCDIQATPLEEESESSLGAPFRNVKGVITNVRIFKDYWSNKERYNQISSRSWYVSPDSARKMLASIEADFEQTNKAKNGEGEYLPYQYGGKFSVFGDGKAHNCPTWCIEKLQLAGVKINESPADKIKCAPQKHVKPGAERVENSLSSETLCQII
jgi:hypothetical protein